MAHLAWQHPGHAAYLQASSQAARKQVARQNDWADRQDGPRAAGRNDVA